MEPIIIIISIIYVNASSRNGYWHPLHQNRDSIFTYFLHACATSVQKLRVIALSMVLKQNWKVPHPKSTIEK